MAQMLRLEAEDAELIGHRMRGRCSARSSIPRRQARVGVLTVAALAAIVGGGCTPTYYVPDVAGVVVREESVAGHAREFTMVLADGRRVTVDPSSSTQLLPLEPRVGDLALVGSVPKPWYGGVPPFAPGNCFSTTGNKVQDAGGFIEFGTYRNDGAWVWIRVPKAAHFNPGPLPSGGSTETHGGLCLDDQGRAISLM